MPVTIKVNGTSNGLVHKGTTHLAKSTAPDVCKTPSPAGPVPIPYPIIISMSSDLANGTTTVKADGGNMCANKGSEFSRCTGDEPGTAGGVVSNVNMKEATWILYSFDVKLDGKNACRFSDLMKMNHGNTICMNGVLPDQTAPKQYPVNADCGEKAKTHGWEPCDFEQVCQMAKAYNSSTQPKKKVDYSPRKPATPAQIPDPVTRAAQHKLAADYAKALRDFKSSFKKLVEAKKAANPSGYMDDPEIRDKFNTTCERDRWKAAGGKSEPSGSRPKGINPDHQHPTSPGGDPMGALKWANSDVNQTVGPSMAGHNPDDPKEKDGVVAHDSCGCA